MPRRITQQQATQGKVAINSLIKSGKKLSDLSDEQLHVLALTPGDIYYPWAETQIYTLLSMYHTVT